LELRVLDEGCSDDNKSSSSSWTGQFCQSFQIFRTTKPMLLLSVLFFYTGFNQPYQQSTFGNRFFTKRTISIELIILHLMEIVGGIYCGCALDDTSLSSSSSSSTSTTSRRRSTVSCLRLFIIVNSLGNLLALHQEVTAAAAAALPATTAVGVADWPASLPPFLAFACWGFADAQIQVYCYWLMGTTLLWET
jgi:hypothetical protein